MHIACITSEAISHDITFPFHTIGIRSAITALKTEISVQSEDMKTCFLISEINSVSSSFIILSAFEIISENDDLIVLLRGELKLTFYQSWPLNVNKTRKTHLSLLK